MKPILGGWNNANQLWCWGIFFEIIVPCLGCSYNKAWVGVGWLVIVFFWSDHHFCFGGNWWASMVGATIGWFVWGGRMPQISFDVLELGGGFNHFICFTPIWGRFPLWLILFKGVWFNHQLEKHFIWTYLNQWQFSAIFFVWSLRNPRKKKDTLRWK